MKIMILAFAALSLVACHKDSVVATNNDMVDANGVVVSNVTLPTATPVATPVTGNISDTVPTNVVTKAPLDCRKQADGRYLDNTCIPVLSPEAAARIDAACAHRGENGKPRTQCLIDSQGYPVPARKDVPR